MDATLRTLEREALTLSGRVRLTKARLRAGICPYSEKSILLARLIMGAHDLAGGPIGVFWKFRGYDVKPSYSVPWPGAFHIDRIGEFFLKRPTLQWIGDTWRLGAGSKWRRPGRLEYRSGYERGYERSRSNFIEARLIKWAQRRLRYVND